LDVLGDDFKSSDLNAHRGEIIFWIKPISYFLPILNNNINCYYLLKHDYDVRRQEMLQHSNYIITILNNKH